MTLPVPHRMPWEPVPVEETVKAMQRDMAYMVTHTAIAVHSNRPELRHVVNTRRGQIVPRGEVKYADGTTIEFQDIGMPQPGVEAMSVSELFERVLSDVGNMGLGVPL